MITRFKPTGTNRWDIRVDGRKCGRIEKRRGSFVAVLTRHVDLLVLDGVCLWVADLNKQH